jgi:hypothetical protein
VGPVYDWAFFILPPVLSLTLGIWISGTAIADDPVEIRGQRDSLTGFFIGTLIHAHLVAVFVRSHGNREIFRLYPVRFTLVPILLWGAIVASPWIAVATVVVATFWDVWHSGAQTFGFARIYDRNAGVPPEMGRRLDFWLNQVIYAGPILGGATLAEHLDSFHGFASIGDTFFSRVPAHVEGHQRYLTWAVLAGGTAFLVYYVLAYWRLHRRGYRFSFPKVYLLVSTAFCSIYTWGFNTWGEAFFIMNLFHAVQYLALVWVTEKSRIVSLVRAPASRAGTAYAACVFVGGALLYGFGVQLVDQDLLTLWALTMVVSIMHFWYDAFIWSVRKRQI